MTTTNEALLQYMAEDEAITARKLANKQRYILIDTLTDDAEIRELDAIIMAEEEAIPDAMAANTRRLEAIAPTLSDDDRAALRDWIRR